MFIQNACGVNDDFTMVDHSDSALRAKCLRYASASRYCGRDCKWLGNGSTVIRSECRSLARGINTPTRIPFMDRLQEQGHLDENFNALAILVDFSDNTSRTGASTFDQLLFGNAQGTLPHYISQITYGNLTIVTVNVPSALGWRRAPQTYAYYVNAQNGFGTYPRNAQKLTEDAIVLVDGVVNFANYDNDGDGYVDALFIVHAGTGAEYSGNSNHIWSHKWQTSSPRAVDGVFAYVYSMEPELWANPGDMTVGVYAHELGHAAFGLPDLYDTGNDSYGLGRWSLMAGGSWNGSLGSSPAHPDAWCKVRMGVVTPTVVTSSQLSASIPNVENNATIYKLAPSGGGSEYILVENRQQLGYDASLGGSGLLIYHIDDAVYGNNNQWYPGRTGSGHYQVALEQADALWQIEQMGNQGNSGDPYPGSTNNRNYNASSSPNSKNYADQLTGIAVQNISNSGATMTADLYGSQPPSVALTAPNGGETWFVGDADTIRWAASGFSGNVAIDINHSYPSGAWTAVTSSTSNTGWYRWVVTSGTTSAASIRVRSVNVPSVRDSSDAVFAITPRSITITAPNTTVTWLVGDSADITWTSQNMSENVSIEINRTYPSATWTMLASSVANTGAYHWLVSSPTGGTARIRVSGTTHTSVRDTSNTNFTIGSRSITVTSPNTAVIWVSGDTANIQWSSSNMSGEPVLIELNRSYPAGSWETIAASTANDGTHLWPITEPITTSARVRITGTTHANVIDVSNVNFTIARRTITVSRPNSNLTFITGGPDTIRWTSSNLSGNVRVELNRSYPTGNWETLASSVSNSGWYRWNVAGQATTNARLRVSAVNYSGIADTSDTDFTITSALLTLIAPNGGEVKLEGDPDTIRWSSTNLSENIRIDLNRSYPTGSWVTIVTSAPNIGSYIRNMPSGITASARLRIVAINHSSVADTSDANFTIARSSVTVTSPNTATTWIVGDSADVTWTSQYLSENVMIEINRTYPSATWTSIATNIANSGSYRCLVSAPTGASTRIRVSGTTHSSVRDTSNTNFSISQRSITVNAPNTATTYVVGDAANITWSAPLLTEPVLIELNRGYPSGSWETVAASTPNDGTYSWAVTGPITTAARVRITGTEHATVTDVSNVNFTIGQRTIAVTRPNTNITLITGGPDTLRWTSTNMSGNVRIEVSRSYPDGTWEVLTSNASNTGVYVWNVAGAQSTTARVRVSAVNFASVADTSDTDFTITTASLTLLAPNGGEAKYEGDPDTIRWSSTNLSENVRIDLNRAYPSTNWVTIVPSASNTGSYVRNIPSGATTTARLRVVAINHPSVSDTSDANFTVARRTLTVTSPNTAVTWAVGDSNDITWTSQNLSENVNIEINRSYPSSTWTMIAANVGNSGTYRWLVSSPTCGTARIRISGATHSAVRDTSNTNFNIAQRGITVSVPNSNVVWAVGDSASILWTTTCMGNEPVNIELNRNYPSGTWETVVESTPNDGTHRCFVSEPVTTAARIRITGTVHTNVSDESNTNFTIARRSITLTKPNGGEVWVGGRADTIRWTSANMSGNVAIALNRNYPNGAWETITSSTANNGSYRWVTGGALTENGRMRVTSVNFAAVGDTSNAAFAIRVSGAAPSTPGGLGVDGITGNSVVPTEFALEQNFPNPFNSTTQIRFALPQAGYVSVMAYDLLGREVSTLLRGERDAGWHQIGWQATGDSGRSLPTGTYLIQMISGEFMQTRKVVLMR